MAEKKLLNSFRTVEYEPAKEKIVDPFATLVYEPTDDEKFESVDLTGDDDEKIIDLTGDEPFLPILKKAEVKLRDFDKVERFRTFLYENYDKCFMKDIDYSINKEVIKKWKECLKLRYVDKLEETKKMTESKFLTYDNEFLSTITEEDGRNIVDFADVIDASMTRIKFSELLKQTELISKQLIKYLKSFSNQKKEIVIIIDNHLYSSNTWYTMLVMKPLFDIPEISARIVNVVDKVSQFQGGQEIPDSSDSIKKHQDFHLAVKNRFLQYKDTFFIHADDMSYSGTQLLGNIPRGLKYLFISEMNYNFFTDQTKIQFVADTNTYELIGYTTNRYFIAIPYIGSQAMLSHFPQMDLKIGTISPVTLKSLSIFQFPENMTSIPSISQSIYEKYGRDKASSISQTLNKSYFKKLFRYSNNSLPIFFDHKLADAISTLTYLISYSTCSTIDESDLIIGHMVTSCKPPPIKEIVDEREDKLRSSRIVDFIDESSRCPVSFYKTLNYTYRGIPLANKNASSMTTKYYVGRALNKAPFI